MVERFLGPVVGHRLLFVILAMALFYMRLLPLQTSSVTWPGPDLLMCLAFCWTLRRPEFLPFWLVAGVILIEDLLMMRPPGLWAALIVGATEFLRTRIDAARGSNFGVEWVLVSVVMAAVFLLNRLVFSVSLLPATPFDTTVLQLLATIFAYPLVVGVSIFAFGLRRLNAGDGDARGRRI